MTNRNPSKGPASALESINENETQNATQTETSCLTLGRELSEQINREFGPVTVILLEQLFYSHFGQSFQDSCCRGQVKAAHADAKKILKRFLADFEKYVQTHSQNFETIDLPDELEAPFLNLGMNAEHVDEELDNIDEIVEQREARAGSTKGAPLGVAKNSLVYELAELLKDKSRGIRWKIIREIIQKQMRNDCRLREAFAGAINEAALRQCYKRESKRRQRIKVGDQTNLQYVSMLSQL